LVGDSNFWLAEFRFRFRLQRFQLDFFLILLLKNCQIGTPTTKFGQLSTSHFVPENNYYIFSHPNYIMPPSSHLLKMSYCHLNIYSKQVDVMMAGQIIMPPSSHLLKTNCHHLIIYSKQVDVIMAGQIIMPPSSHLLKTSCRHLNIYSKRVDVIMAYKKKAGKFSDS
jgi:hypothetical protein